VLTLRGGIVGVIGKDTLFAPLPLAEHIVFDHTLYVPPLGSKNREQHGTLGNYRLNLGDAVGMHGTTEPSSVGRAVTHGCMRLYDADIEWLYRIIPIGTPVYIY
jgi:L,D-transpeptidase-like protein